MDSDDIPGSGGATTAHDEPAYVRERGRPMFGCLKGLFWFGVIVVLFLVMGAVSFWFWTGTTNFAEFVRKRVEVTLESRLSREVTIGKVDIVRGVETRAILSDVRIANVPGASHPYFFTAKQIVIAGGVDSFWGRRVKVGRVDIRAPWMSFEVLPKGSQFTHNFPKWKTGPKRRFEIYRLDISRLFVHGGMFEFVDRQRDVSAVVSQISADVTPTLRQSIYAGVVNSPNAVLRIQEYLPIPVTLRGGFLFTPGVLELKSIALRGRGIETFLSGKIEPVTEAVYNFDIQSRLELERVQEIFKVERPLRGMISLDGTLRGTKGDFTLATAFNSAEIVADTYELSSLRGNIAITDQNARVVIDRGSYGGGTIAATYELAKYAEPYPMTVDLRYQRISLEKLFEDWTVRDTGLRGAATGRLTYSWNKDKLLDGSGDGDATFTPGTVAFGNAPYPMALSGATKFALDRGVISFGDSRVATNASTIGFSGTLKIDDLDANLRVAIRSDDFSELDRVAFNFARSAGKRDYELLGLGGRGAASGTVRGPFKAPLVSAHVEARDTEYRNVLLGDSVIDLRYAGPQSLLTFERASFRLGESLLSLAGTIAFPDRGPSPRFDLDVTATGYPVDRALQAIALDLKVFGTGTGSLHVGGTPDAGSVTFKNMRIAEGSSRLDLRGDIRWSPGKGNVAFDLDLAAQNVEAKRITDFLDFGNVPVSGAVTGTLHLEGPKAALSGAGSVTLRNGVIFGEPVESATADLLFTSGVVRATHAEVRSTAGVITGEGEYNLETEKFSYLIRTADIDLDKVKALEGLRNVLGGRLRISSTGAGTLAAPEIVIEATLEQPRIGNLVLPPDAPAPSIYLAIRGGEMVLRGSAFDLVTIEGSGTVATNGALDGRARVHISDIGRLLSIVAPGIEIGASGPAVAELRLTGNTNSLAAIRVDGTVPELAFTVSGHSVTAAEPIRFSYADGTLTIDSFKTRTDESVFALAGSIEFTGEKRIDLDLQGLVEAALIQLFVPEMRASGHIDVAARVGGTLADPRINGTAEVQGAELKLAGFPQLISGITGAVVFRGDAIEIDSMRADLGGGTVVAGGTLEVANMGLRRMRLSFRGDDVSLRYYEGITVDGDFNLLLTGDPERMLLQGDVAVDQALYSRDFDFATSILNLLLERRVVLPEVAASWQDRVALRVHLSAPETLAVRNNIADVTGSASLDLTGTLANPVVLGEVTIDEGGKVRFQDVNYRVTRGTITFQNPFRIDPYFDVTAEGRMQEYDLTINLTGTLDRINPVITSDPPAGDITLLSLLTSNVGPSGRNPIPSLTSFSSLGTAGTSFLVQSLGGFLGNRLLPFADSFRIDPGQVETLRPTVTFEKQISRNVRAIVTYSQEDQRRIEVIEWQATPDWIIQFEHRSEDRSAQIEEISVYALDARFRRRYEGRWGGREREQQQRNVAAGREGTSRSVALAELPPVPLTEERIVTTVRFRPDTNFNTEPLHALVATKLGEPLTIRGVQDSIKALYATGDFRDIQVDATETPAAGVELTYRLSINYRVDEIELVGVGRLGDRARRELQFRRGEVFSLNAVDRSATAIQTLLRRRGHLEATVDPEVRFSRAENLADVTLHVDRGPEAKVAAVQIEGDFGPFAEAELLEELRLEPGDDYSLNRARDAAERLERHLVRNDHRRASVRLLGENYDPATDSATVSYRVEVGPKVKVEVVGVSRRAVRRWLPFGRREEYSADRLARAQDAIIDGYQRRGHFFVTVDVREQLVGDAFVITFVVRPGNRYRLDEVIFEGNTLLSDRRLREVTTTAPIGGFRRLLGGILRRPLGITQETINDDRDSIEAFYRLEGFTEAEVGQPRVVAGVDGTMDVVFPISEGPRTLVTEVKVEGNEKVAAAELPELLVANGDPLNPIEVNSDVIALQTHYGQSGYAEVQVAPRVALSDDKKSATVTYRIAEGPKVAVDEVIVRGNTYTDESVIRRKAGLKEGEPFSYRALLEAQRELQRLAIFQRVEVQPQKASTSPSERDVTLEVEEGRNLSIGGSLGYSTDEGARGSASIAHRNLFGTARYLGLDARISERENRYVLTYREPFTFRFNVPTQLTLFQSEEQISTAFVTGIGAFVEASRVVREQTRWSLRYEYRLVDCDERDDDTPVCSELRREQQDVAISSIAPTFFWDRRDDALNPHRGFFANASLEYAFPFIDARTSFVKGFAQSAWYRPIGRTTLAVSGRLGLTERLSDIPSCPPLPDGSPDLDCLENAALYEVPISEKFFAGGETSHRAYAVEELGLFCELDPMSTCDGATLTLDKDGEIVPLGGLAMSILNVEYRFPLFGSLSGSVFTDIGNVWRDIDSIDFGDLRYGVGAGVRYVTPVGPIRFDVGYKLNPAERNGERIEDPVAFFLTIGYPF